MGGAAFEAVQYVLQAVAHRRVAPGLLDAFTALFDGHDIPAIWWARHRKPGFYKAPSMSRRLAFEAHLLGAVMAGAYPFRGASPWCKCSPRHHVCDGGGTRYLCVDLDAKRGERDTESRTRDLVAVCWRAGLVPVVFSSRSGCGAHVFIFFDKPTDTRTAHAAGRNLALAAGITERCDIIPSAEHYAGLGTLHALPLSPLAESGGGVLFDSDLRPISDLALCASTLRWADANRVSTSTITSLADGSAKVCQETTQRYVRPLVRRSAASRPKPKLTEADDKLLSGMRKSHPQFRSVLSSSASSWKGKRSSRDAYLVSYMRRQGMSGAGVVAAMLLLPGTKASARGPDFAWALVESLRANDALTGVVLAGEPLARREAKAQRTDKPWAPWDAKLAPPRDYDGRCSPWWEASVQDRIRSSRSRLDGIVLAHLIDRYFRGPDPIRRRMFFASQRGLSDRLNYPPRTINGAIARIDKRFPDVMRVVPGVSHPTLRIANGYYVPERMHYDKLNWYAERGSVRLS